MILKSKSSIDEAVLQVCKLWAEERSKDPSTKVGACVYDPRSGGLFMGYNGFPAGVADEEVLWNQKESWTKKVESTMEDDLIGVRIVTVAAHQMTKYDVVIHAEVNAVRKALLAGVDLKVATLYCTHVPCPTCMKNVVLGNGIQRVVYLTSSYPSRDSRDNFVVDNLAKLGGVRMERLPAYHESRDVALDQLLGVCRKCAHEPANKGPWYGNPNSPTPGALIECHCDCHKEK